VGRQQAPRHAPSVDRRLVGAAMGGTPADLAHLLSYIDGSVLWAGAIPLGLHGLSLAYDIDLGPYLSERGKQVKADTSDQCISQVLGPYAGLRFVDLTKPAYSSFSTIPPLARIRPQVVMGRAGTPTAPLFFAAAKLDDTGDGFLVTQRWPPATRHGAGVAGGVLPGSACAPGAAAPRAPDRSERRRAAA
jgi:hypothetical protein